MATTMFLTALLSGIAGIAMAEPIKVPPGTMVELELQQHVTSAYVSPGSPIYFRIANDVKVGDRTVIAAGTLAHGRMIDAQARGMVGKSGSMSLGVRQIQAVDGSWVAVDADLAKQGRSRTGATIGWIVFWGIPGLITKGVNPYLERGTIIDGTVMAEATVDPDKVVPRPAGPDLAQALPIVVTNHAFDKFKDPDIKFDIERDKDLGTITFTVEPPAGIADTTALMGTAELLAVDGKPVPMPIRPTATTANSMTFDAWSLIQFIHNGETKFAFRMRTTDGIDYVAERALHVTVQKKEKKKAS